MSHKRNTGKQCWHSSDATERGICPVPIRFALNAGISLKRGNNKNKPNTHLAGNVPIQWIKAKEIIRPKWVKGTWSTWYLFYHFREGRQVLWLSVCLSANQIAYKKRSKLFPCRKGSKSRLTGTSSESESINFITKIRVFKYNENFTNKKWKFSNKKFWYFSYFCSKHRLWVLVGTASMRRF